MEEHDKSIKLSPEIYVYATNKNFLNLYDALRINKVKIEVAGYDPASNRQTGHASAWLDKDEARLLCHLVANRLFKQVTGGKWEKYGGSQREDGSIESRTILLEWDEGDGGRFARFPYRITVSNGPGRKTDKGGVSPAGEPSARLTMRIPELDMIKLMLVLGDYIQAYDTAHHHRLVAQRLQDLREKLAERGSPVSHARTDSSEPRQPGRQADREMPPIDLDTDDAALKVPAAGRPPLRAMPGGNREPVSMQQRPARLGNTKVG